MANNKNTILISCEGDNSALFWKRSVGNTSERIEVLVPETHYAVTIKDGKYLDTFSGGKYVIREKSRKNPTAIDIIFMSKTLKLRMLWGTKNRMPFTDVGTNESFSLGACGEYEVQIASPKHFYLELVGCDDHYDANRLKERLHSKLLSRVEHELRSIIAANKWQGRTLSAHKQQISEALENALSRMLELEYGLRLCSFITTNVVASFEGSSAIKASEKKEGRCFCTACGVELERDDKYCFNCGAKTANTAVRRTSVDIHFCSECGKKMCGGDE